MRYVLLTLVALLVLVLSVWPISDTDVWTHLALGRHIARTHSVPHHDVLSYTAPPDRPWVDHEWLYQVILFGGYELGGVPAITLLTAGMTVGAFLIVGLSTFRRGTWWFGAAVLALGALTAYQRFQVRPEVFSFLLTAAFLAELEFWRENPESRSVFLLPALQILWVNLHGYFVVGPALVLAYLIGEAALEVPHLPHAWKERHMGQPPSLRRLTLVLGLVIAACFVSPYHWRAALYPVEALRQVAAESVWTSNIGELFPPWRAAHTMMWLGLRILGILALAGFLVNIRRTDPVRVILCVLAGYASYSTMRNVPYFVLIAAPATVMNFHEAWDDLRQWHPLRKLLRFVEGIRWAISGILVVGLLWTTAWVVSGGVRLKDVTISRFGFGVDPMWFSPQSVGFLDGAKGRAFNNFGSGGWLAFMRRPGQDARVFIDGRAELYQKDFYGQYKSVLEDGRQFDRLASEYGIDAVYLQLASPDVRDMVRGLAVRPGWRLAYRDCAAVIFVRSPAGVTSPVGPMLSNLDQRPDRTWYDRVQEKLWFLPARKVYRQALVGEVQFRFLMGDYAGALAALTVIEQASQPCAYLLSLRAQLEESSGQLQAARQHLEDVIRMDVDFPGARQRLDGLLARMSRRPG